MTTKSRSCKHFGKSPTSVMSEENGGKARKNKQEWKEDAEKTRTGRKRGREMK